MQGEVIVKGTKSGNERVVVLPPTIIEELRRHKDLQKEQRAMIGSKLRGESWICAEPDGRMFTVKGLGSGFYHLAKEAGIVVTLHGLRHTWVTEQLAAGVPSETVQKRAGHATIAFTHDRYGHAQPRHQEAAVAVSENLMHPKPRIQVLG